MQALEMHHEENPDYPRRTLRNELLAAMAADQIADFIAWLHPAWRGKIKTEGQ